MPRWPSLEGKNGIDGPTVRLSLGRGAGRRAEHGHRTHRNTSPPFLQLGKRRPRTPGGAAGGVRLAAGMAYLLNVFG